MSFLTICVGIGFVTVLLAVIMALLRLALGPTLPDRVVALDMMTVAIVSFCGLMATQAEDPAFLDVALALALVGFLATVALARFAERMLERRARNDADEDRP
ncbi:monovalent cation/H+ antiporter complex subunit F [Citreimonas salinaria]|uniref:Multisubunit sodium/proton antiporter, MrpF subunit n=1 Tax=Citreimonas salinaria TaxID=321339 RepID=A0A1H3JVE8_9RHOB|nr:cation:proton antiporter [Citreimonas salinaria]SDY43922.1 multisubunit sodium/proton antiporter, MrpF subunit [Citreimonas salinaria]